MKTNHATKLLTAVLGLAALSTGVQAANEKAAPVILPPTMAVVSIAVTSARPGPAANLKFTAVTTSPDAVAARWTDIKDYTYDMRAQFYAGLSRLEARVDAQIGELNARRATMNGTIDTKNWDFEMKEMREARSNLRSVRGALSRATAETWNQAKEKVGQAWVRTQSAYASVKSSTTS